MDPAIQHVVEWRIAGRTMLYDRYTEWGAAADWSQVAMGIPLTGAHYSGTAKSDHSEAFFGRS